MVLPSSHCSGDWTIPSPQRAAVQAFPVQPVGQDDVAAWQTPLEQACARVFVVPEHDWGALQPVGSCAP